MSFILQRNPLLPVILQGRTTAYNSFRYTVNLRGTSLPTYQPNASCKDSSNVRLRADETDAAFISAPDYAKCHKLQMRYNRFVLEFCQLAFETCTDENQQFLDVGCGVGDFTRDVLLPKCMPCRRIVGVDSSPEMVQHARVNTRHEKLQFGFLDICGDVSEFLEEFGQFHRVYSFLCLHWVQDLGFALKNIAKLMTPNGECLLVFFASYEGPEVWTTLGKTDRWSEFYKKTLQQFLPKTQNMSNKQEQVRFLQSLIQDTGLYPSMLEAIQSTFFDDWTEDDIVDTYLSTVPQTKALTAQDKVEMREAVRKQIRIVHSPEERGRYRTFILKASKRRT